MKTYQYTSFYCHLENNKEVVTDQEPKNFPELPFPKGIYTERTRPKGY